jgi:hypothetical protein
MAHTDYENTGTVQRCEECNEVKTRVIKCPRCEKLICKECNETHRC